MRNILSMILLTILLVLLFSSYSFAQDVLLDPSVRLIYFLPNDRPARPDRIEALRQLIKDTQEFYADEMERHGYGRKTFRVETDTDGEPVVHRFDGRFNELHYYQGLTDFKVWEEFFQQVNDLQHVYLIAIDLSYELLYEGESCGLAGVTFSPANADAVYLFGSTAVRHRDITPGEEVLGGSAIMPASGYCFYDTRGFLHPLRVITHELAHAFGLDHNFSDPDSAVGGRGFRFSQCEAEWLSISRFFNSKAVSENALGNIQLISAPTYSAEGIALHFEVTDADGIHQAQLLVPEDGSWGPWKFIGCQELDGQTQRVEFLSSELILAPERVMLQFMDDLGNITWATFLVDIASVLPPPKFVSIPDTNLAEAVRKALDLSPNARITDQEMWGLIRLNANEKQIKNLTGLEHATQLTHLFLYENQISNLDPLSALTHLRELGLDHNNIRDITPLANLRQLQTLFIGRNPISDFTPIGRLNELKALALFSNNIRDIALLANLQQLRWLYLSHNQIQDIRPLAQLTNLETLHLQNNSIHDINPLANLTNLKDLRLSVNQVSDIRSLSSLTNLTTLHLAHNQIGNVGPLVNLINLEELYLSDNPIEDLSPLRTLLANNPNLKIDIEVPPPPPPTDLTFNPNTIADQIFTVEEVVNLTLPIATGGTPPYTYTLAPLPNGLQFDTTTRELQGTPRTAMDATTVTYTATDATGASAALNFTIEVTGTGPEPVDVDGNGQVTVVDLAIVALFYGTRVPAGVNLAADVNSDGVVDLLDLTAVAQAIDAAGGGLNQLPLWEVEAVLLAAVEQAAELEMVAGAPMGFGTRVLPGGITSSNVTAALSDVKQLSTSDVRLGKEVAVLEGFLHLFSEMVTIPEQTALLPNYPNPFNPETWIPYHLSKAAHLTLTIYDMRGVAVRQLVLGHQPMGVYQSRGRAAYWDGRNDMGEPVASGVYFYTLTASDFTATRKLLIVK